MASKQRGAPSKRACDMLFSRLVRSRGRCERCGSTQNLQCAHIISRRYVQTRCDPRNAWCLCTRCHFYVDGHFEAKAELVAQTIGTKTFEELQQQAYSNKGPTKLAFWKEKYEELKRLLGE